MKPVATSGNRTITTANATTTRDHIGREILDLRVQDLAVARHHGEKNCVKDEAVEIGDLEGRVGGEKLRQTNRKMAARGPRMTA